MINYSQNINRIDNERIQIAFWMPECLAGYYYHIINLQHSGRLFEILWNNKTILTHPLSNPKQALPHCVVLLTFVSVSVLRLISPLVCILLALVCSEFASNMDSCPSPVRILLVKYAWCRVKLARHRPVVFKFLFETQVHYSPLSCSDQSHFLFFPSAIVTQ